MSNLARSGSIAKRAARLLVVGPLPPPYYGGSIFTAALVEGLQTLDEYEVRHVNTQGSMGLKDVGKGRLGKFMTIAGQMIDALRLSLSFRPDLVYSPIPAELGGFLRYSLFVHIARLVGARCVVQFHDGQFDLLYREHPGWAQRYARAILHQVDHVIVLGHRIAPMLEGIAPMDRVRVVYGSRDEAPFIEARQRLIARGEPTNERITVLFVSHLFRDKGYFDVLQAASLVLKQRQDIVFKFAGDWPSDEEYQFAKHFVEENRLDEFVHFLGPVTGDAKFDLFVSSDIFVFPSFYRFEAQPSAVIEAMAARLPVIATDWAGLPEMVHDGENGYVVPISDPPAIADRILKLADDPVLRREMGRQGWELFRAEFTRERWLEKTCTVFDEALS